MIDEGQIRRILDRGSEVITVDADASVIDAIDQMSRHNVGCVVITDGRRGIAGILSERDVLMKVIAKRRDPVTTPVRRVMSTTVMHCTRDTAIPEAQKMMAHHGIRHLPIVEGGAVIGMISSRDILAHQLSTVASIAHMQSRLLDRLERAFPGMRDMMAPAAEDSAA